MRSSSGAAIPRSARSVSIFRAPASWSHRPSAIPALAWHEDRSRTQPVAEQIDTPDRGCVGASVNRSGGRIWRHAGRRGRRQQAIRHVSATEGLSTSWRESQHEPATDRRLPVRQNPLRDHRNPPARLIADAKVGKGAD
jgi:hypothetical protein